jgi:hypothetical protein
VRDLAVRLRHPAPADGAAGAGARGPDPGSVRFSAALGGAAVVSAVVDGEAQGSRPRGQLRLRAARAVVADHERRRPRWLAGAQSMFAPHVSRGRRSAAVRCHDQASVGVARCDRRSHASGDPARGVRRAPDGGGRRPARRGRRLHEGHRPSGAAARGGAAEKRHGSHAAADPAGACTGAVCCRVPVGREIRGVRRNGATDLDVGDRASRAWCAAEGGRATGGFPVPRCPALLGVTTDRQRAGREGRPAPAPACQREDDAGHLRPSLAGQRPVRTGRRRRCAGGPWGLVGDRAG